MNATRIAALTVGERVAYAKFHWDSAVHAGFGTVTKINGHGHITIDPEGKPGGSFDSIAPITFDKHGEEKPPKGSYGCGRRLYEPEVLERHYAEKAANHATGKAVDAILAELAGRKTGHGNYHITAETKARLAELVAALPTNG